MTSICRLSRLLSIMGLINKNNRQFSRNIPMCTDVFAILRAPSRKPISYLIYKSALQSYFQSQLFFKNVSNYYVFTLYRFVRTNNVFSGPFSIS